MVFEGVEARVKLRQHLAKFDVVKLVALEQLVDSQLQQEDCVVEGL